MSLNGFPKIKSQKPYIGDRFDTGIPYTNITGNSTAVGTTTLNVTGSGWILAIYHTVAATKYVQITIDGVQLYPNTDTSIMIYNDAVNGVFLRFESSLLVKSADSSLKVLYLLD